MKNCIRKLMILLMAAVLIMAALSVPAAADNTDYGTDAYEYLKYIDQNLGYRITNHEMTSDTTAKNAAGSWIKGTLESFGYVVNTYAWDHEGDQIVSYQCEKPGNSPKKLVIGAHYDCVDTKGVEDNGTGVSLLLELAKRFQNTETNLTLEFCFWDGEETSGFAGSYDYISGRVDPASVLCYINIDCVGVGDYMFAYGGAYEGDTLVRAWPYYMAMDEAYQEGIELKSMPKEVTRFRTPTRDDSSDHFYFDRNGIPYVYFEANRWVKPDGTLTDEHKPFMYNSADPAIESTNGQIIHTQQFEDLATLERIFPGRIQEHMTAYSKIISRMIRDMAEYSPTVYEWPIEHPTEPETSSEEPETEETEAPTESSEPETETEAPETETEPETESTVPEPSSEEPETAEPENLLKRPDAVQYLLGGAAGLCVALAVFSIIQAVRLKNRS